MAKERVIYTPKPSFVMDDRVHIERQDLVQAPPEPLWQYVPEGWTKGELLSQLSMANGFRFSPAVIGMDAQGRSLRPQLQPYVEFTHADEAQNFIGWWYAR